MLCNIRYKFVSFLYLAIINGLSGITSSLEYLVIALNDKITNLDGLSNIGSINGNLNIIDNDNLTDLCGIQIVVKEDFVITGNTHNPSLQDFIDGNCSQ